MNHYLASDVHLRSDCPDRDLRFARWVRRIEDNAALLVLGDLCDFFQATRVPESSLMESPGLQALADLRTRGGSLAIMPGNHDRWLCPFYVRMLGASILDDPSELTIHGLRLHLVHGHLLGARRKWKALMETRQFFHAFGRLPGPLAGLLDDLLERKNQRGLEADELRHLAVYRDYAARFRDLCDLVVIGHVHRPVDEAATTDRPRMIVLGGWQRQASYLRIDPVGASFQVVPDAIEESRSSAAASHASSVPPSRNPSDEV